MNSRTSFFFRFLLFSLLACSFSGILLSCKGTPTTPGAVEIGKPAPDFELADSKGRVWRLSDLKGNVVFLNFWATWCPPCREEMPSMVALNKGLEAEHFQMVTILSNDDPARAESFLRKVNGNLPVLVDADGRTAADYGLTGVPETFIIDAQGILRKKIIGGHDWNSQAAHDLIGSYLP